MRLNQSNRYRSLPLAVSICSKLASIPCSVPGLLEIDNNIAERTMRLCAIGRKNWLFVRSDRGGETAATCFSILAGAKRHRLEPFAYVRDLLVAISTGEPDWNALLPDVSIAAHPEHFLHYRRDEAEAAA